MKQTYTGGCHCGAVRYEADVDLSQGTVKCNCSICTKGRAWLIGVDPADFRLLRGEDVLGEYQFGAHRIRHLFCKTCGIKSFARGTLPDGTKFGAILVNCLEGLTDEQLGALPVMYIDGRNDDFQKAPAHTSHL